MSAATTHCDRIISLIDDCLDDYERSLRTPCRPPVAAGPMTPGASWWRLVPTGHPLGRPALSITG